MDDDTLREIYRQSREAALADGQTKFTRRMVINLADFAGETPRGLVLRLERLGCRARGTWNWFVENGGITPEQIRQVRADRSAAERAPHGEDGGAA